MDKSPLGRLSAELRNEIYQLLVLADKPLAVCKNHSTPESSATQPPITRVCRQIREESLGMFYHGNIFIMELISTTFWGHHPDWDDIHERTKEVTAWLQCTNQKNHDSTKHPVLMICVHVCERLKYVDWEPLMKALKACGYGRNSEEEQKLKVTVHIISDEANYENFAYSYDRVTYGRVREFIQEMKDEASELFDASGLNVKVNLTWLHTLRFGHCLSCQGMVEELSNSEGE
ncbi:unnamed protein product [Cercospora beticola]|nr:unnamed protein product [Cercospora beticola]